MKTPVLKISGPGAARYPRRSIMGGIVVERDDDYDERVEHDRMTGEGGAPVPDTEEAQGTLWAPVETEEEAKRRRLRMLEEENLRGQRGHRPRGRQGAPAQGRGQRPG